MMIKPTARTTFPRHAAVLFLLIVSIPAWGQGATVTYQGQLQHSGTPYYGTADMEFRFYDDPVAGSQIGATVNHDDVPVAGGLFQVELDVTVFDFDGPRYLEITVDGNTLSPRQPVTATPIAAYALWSPAGDGSPWETVPGGIEYNAGQVRMGTTGFGNIRLNVVNSDLGSHAIRGRSGVVNGWGLWGQSITASNDARAVFGEATATSGQNKGVYAHTNSPDGFAVYATGAANSRNFFQRNVNIGANVSNTAFGPILSVQTDTNQRDWAASISNTNTGATGIHGALYITSGGVNNNRTIWANADTSFAIFAQTNQSGARGIVGQASGTGSFGVFANGNLGASGTKTFQIDHPLDPANQYLLHFATEGPEPYNVYSGRVVLDEHGEARVELPAYFAHINRDYRYQLTAIGAPAPYLHVAEEIIDNVFIVAGGHPGLKVSWSVTAVRDDPGTRANPLQAEIPKPDLERGTYLHPAAYGRSDVEGVFHVEAPRLPVN